MQKGETKVFEGPNQTEEAVKYLDSYVKGIAAERDALAKLNEEMLSVLKIYSKYGECADFVNGAAAILKKGK